MPYFNFLNWWSNTFHTVKENVRVCCFQGRSELLVGRGPQINSGFKCVFDDVILITGGGGASPRCELQLQIINETQFKEQRWSLIAEGRRRPLPPAARRGSPAQGGYYRDR